MFLQQARRHGCPTGHDLQRVGQSLRASQDAEGPRSQARARRARYGAAAALLLLVASRLLPWESASQGAVWMSAAHAPVEGAAGGGHAGGVGGGT